MIQIRKLALGFTVLILAGGLAACGSSSSSGGAQTVSPGSGSSSSGTSSSAGDTVTIKGFAFHPSTLTVKVGTKVTFTNEDDPTHTATSSGDTPINSGNLSKGQSYTVTFTKPGTYNYICSIHQYMKGTIVVQ
jgi:plastocyanin